MYIFIRYHVQSKSTTPSLVMLFDEKIFIDPYNILTFFFFMFMYLLII